MTTALLRRNRNFRLLFSGSAASNLGDGVAALAFPWLATLISRDPLDIALVAFATRLPWFLFSLPAGVITDRADRQKLMVRADLMRVVLSFGVVALILSGPALPAEGNAAWMIYGLSGLAFLLGCAEVVRDNAAQTVLPSLVEKDALERANGQLWSIEQIMGSFIGPPIAGLLIALAVPAPFLFDAVAFALAAFAVWSIAFPPRLSQPMRRSFWDEFREGAAWILGHRLILQLAIMLGLLNALHMAGFTLLVLYSQEILGFGAFGHAVLMTAGAAGGVLGGLLCPMVAARLGPLWSLRVALLLFPLPFLVLYATSSPVVAALVLFVEMLAAVLWNVVTVSYRQRAIPEEILGRVNAIYRFFGWGMMPLGALAGGWIMAMVEPDLGREAALRLPYLLAALGMVGLLVYGFARLRFPETDGPTR